MTSLRILLVLLVLILSAPGAPLVRSEAAAAQETGWEGVTGWRCTITVTVQGTLIDGGTTSVYTRYSTSRGTIGGSSFVGGNGSWYGQLAATTSIDDRHVGERARRSERGVSAHQVQAAVQVNLRDKTYAVDVTVPSIEVRIQNTVPDPLYPPRDRRHLATRPHLSGAHIADRPLPERPSVLSGSITVPHYITKGDPNGIPATVSWTIAPIVEDVELVVEVVGYETWEPSASTDETAPGDHVTVTGTLRKRGGGETAVRARRIRFELERVSSEPGIAMNYPLTPGPPRPDLRFLKEMNSDLRITGTEGAKAETPPGQHASATATLSSFDYGAWGTLRVVAETDLGEIVGHLEGDENRLEILLPKRRDYSLVSDVYLAAQGEDRADAEDLDDQPAGDGHAGDGLTLYQEYRGFLENGTHRRSSATQKTLFIRDRIQSARTRQPILDFAALTGIQVFSQLTAEETPTSRVINQNRSAATPHVVDQHLLLIVQDRHDTHLSVTGGPGLPRVIEYVNAAYIFDAEGIRLHRRLLPHELLHATNVWHHGERDPGKVRWQYDEGTGWLENGRPITVLDESRAPYDIGPVRPFEVWVSTMHGQHSGDVACLMRYIPSRAYTSATSDTTRYRAEDDAPSTGICSHPAGTGYNSNEHTPQPRHGSADPAAAGEHGPERRGNCRAQICLNDAMHHPREIR